jgi:FOG: EAL domain
MNILQFDIVAFLLLGISLFLFYNQKNVRNRAGFWFKALLWNCLAGTLFSAVSSAIVNHQETFAPAVAQLVFTLYLLLHNTIMILAMAYIMAMTGRTPATRLAPAAMLVPCLASAAAILADPWTGWLYAFDGVTGFQARGGVIFLYAAFTVYLVTCAILLYSRRKHFTGAIRVIIPLALFLPGVGVTIQYLCPGLVLENFAASVALLLILFTIQNSSEVIDSSTGLFNRRAFNQQVEMRLTNRSSFGVLLLSLQNIGLLRHIYDIQDLIRLFQEIARFLAGQTDRQGQAFYLGNDSFALVLGNSLSEREKRDIEERIRERFMKSWQVDNARTEIPVRFCLLHCPEEASTVSDIIDCLEQLPAITVRNGHSGIIEASQLNLVGRKREEEVQQALRRAISSNGIEILYQPIFSVLERKCCFADALITIREKGQDWIQQGELIRVAERHGLMQRIGSMALDSVCAFYQNNRLRDQGLASIQLRLASTQCMQGDLPQQILAITEAHGINPHHICFEITETTAVHTPAIMHLNMKMLSGLEFSFALDDYGSGYTDLGYIMEMPFSVVKLDKSIIQSGFTTSKGKVVLNSTIALLKRLNKKIVAEGVETMEQAEVLTILGCDFLQGYYFSGPLPGRDFLELLEKRTRNPASSLTPPPRT